MAIGRPISLTPNIATKAINSVATANQTDFTVTGGYRINELAVYRNGVRLAQGRDFTANDGTTVTLTNGATVNDVIEFVVFDSFNVADAIVSVASSQTVSGDLNVTGKFYSGSIDPNSLNVAGVGTITRISNTSLVATSATVSSALHVGSALTANAAGDVESIGIITAASFSGDGSALVGVANTDFVVSVATTTGNLNVSAAATITGDLTVSDSIAVTKDINIGAAATITGALSAGAISGSTGTFSGAVNVDATTDSTSSTSGALIVDGGLGVAKNVFIGAGLSVAGTLTYEDVTNVDSVGLITAKSGVNITGGELTVGSGITMGIAGVATFSGTSDVHLLDNVQLNVGDGSDLSLYHDGSHSYIKDSGTGNLKILSSLLSIKNPADSTVMIQATVNDSVDLYYNNSKKFETTNDGTSTTGIATATVGIDAAISVWTLGASGSSHYTFTGPGNLSATTDPTLNLIRGQKYTFRNRSGGHPFRIQSTPNGSSGTQYNNGVTNNDGGNGTDIIFDVPYDAPAILYYQCTSHGSMGGPMYIGGSGYEISVGSGITFGSAGVATFSGTSDVHLHDGVRLLLGTGSDLRIQHDGSHGYIQENTGNLRIDGDLIQLRSSAGENYLIGNANDAVDIYFNGSKKFETTNDGTVTSGIATATRSYVNTPSQRENDNIPLLVKGITKEDPVIGVQGINANGVTLLADSYVDGESQVGLGLQYSGSGLFLGRGVGVSTDTNNSYVSLQGQYAYKPAGIVVDNAIKFRTDSVNGVRPVGTAVTMYDRVLFDSTGDIDIYGTAAGITSAKWDASANSFYFKDNSKAYFGDSSDLSIYHDGSNSYIKHAGTGSLIVNAADSGEDIYIRAADDVFIQTQTTENSIKAIGNGAVELYHNNVKQLSTRSDGIEIHSPEGGEAMIYMTADEGDDNTDKYRLVAQNGGDWLVQRYTGSAYSSELRVGSTSGVQLNYQGNAKLNTTNDGVVITGIATVSQGANFDGILTEKYNETAGKVSDNPNIDLEDGMIHFFTTTESTTSTPNLRYNSSKSLNNMMSVGDSLTVTIILSPAAGGYSNNLSIDGSGVTEEWNGGSAPSSGGSGGYDVYSYTVLKRGNASFTVLANVQNYA